MKCNPLRTTSSTREAEEKDADFLVGEVFQVCVTSVWVGKSDQVIESFTPFWGHVLMILELIPIEPAP